MPGMNNFFNELIEKDYFEKQASENENIKNALGDCSSSVLQKLAHELGALSEEKPSIQEKLAETDSEEEKEEDKEAETECGASDSEEKEEEKEEDKEAESDSDSEEEKDEDKEAESDSDEEEKEEDEDKEAGEFDGDMEKEAMEKEAFEKEAYFVAQEKLASSDLSVADFIFEKCANEHVSEYIAETAEKLASMYDKSALQIADEILDSVMSKLG